MLFSFWCGFGPAGTKAPMQSNIADGKDVETTQLNECKDTSSEDDVEVEENSGDESNREDSEMEERNETKELTQPSTKKPCKKRRPPITKGKRKRGCKCHFSVKRLAQEVRKWGPS